MVQQLAARKMGASVDARKDAPFPLTVGFGTTNLANPRAFVRIAVEEGFRVFDTATQASSEQGVGAALGAAVRDGKVQREDLFITTKVWTDDMGYEKALDSVRNSSLTLGKQFPGSFTRQRDGKLIQGLEGGLDLVLVQWPGAYIKFAKEGNDDIEARSLRRETWDALEMLQRGNEVKQIGVANFGERHLKELLRYANIKPAVNQIEIHPYNQREELVKLCQKEGIAVEAYSPLGGGGFAGPSSRNQGQLTDQLLADPVLKKIADKYSKSTAQVILRWNLQRGITPIPKASSDQHIQENLKVFDFELADGDMRDIKELERAEFIVMDDEKLA
jgi:diketogulonate reductase-like aldo/keto reductase